MLAFYKFLFDIKILKLRRELSYNKVRNMIAKCGLIHFELKVLLGRKLKCLILRVRQGYKMCCKLL